MADDRDFLKAGNIGFDKPMLLVLDDPGYDGSPWFHSAPDNKYNGRPSPFWLMHVTERESGKKWTLKLTGLMHTAVRDLHEKEGLGANAVFTMTRTREGRKTLWQFVLVQAGSPPAMFPDTAQQTPSSRPQNRATTFGNPTSEFGPMRNRNDVPMFTKRQARKLWEEAIERAREAVPELDPKICSDAECAANQSVFGTVLATFVIFARDAVPPSQFAAGEVRTTDQEETRADQLRGDLFEKAIERNLDTTATAAEMVELFMKSPQKLTELLQMAIDDFENFASLVLQRMSGQENQDAGPEVDPNVDTPSAEGEDDEQD